MLETIQFGSAELAAKKKTPLASSVLAVSSPGSCVACAGLVAWFLPRFFPLVFAGLDFPLELADVC